MITLDFEGFFQVRLATDPDSFAEKRGRLGWTFAYGKEPDLDRVVRFNNPVALRSHAPAVGVRVKSVNGSTTHRLVGATLDMSPNAVFEGRNHAIANDGNEPISPMKVSVAQTGFLLAREGNYVITDRVSRGPYMGKGVVPCPDPMVRGLKLSSPVDGVAYREARKASLETDLAATTDPNTRLILQSRIDAIEETSADHPAVVLLALAVNYKHPLSDAVTVTDPGNLLGASLDTTQPWQIQYWLGTFDADTLTGYARGQLMIPTT